MTSVIAWILAELDYAGKLDPCPAVHGRIAALREVLYRLEKVA